MMMVINGKEMKISMHEEMSAMEMMNMMQCIGSEMCTVKINGKTMNREEMKNTMINNGDCMECMCMACECK